MPTPSLKDKLTAQFGTDEALGVTFHTEDGEILSAKQFDELSRARQAAGEEIPCGDSYLPNGGSGTCCTDYAACVYIQLPGRVKMVGFSNDENPDCQVAKDELHPCGHDFAVVDNRYLVDPWCKLVVGNDWQVVYDMSDPADLALVHHRYGPRECWTHMVAAQAYAAKQAASMKLVATL